MKKILSLVIVLSLVLSSSLSCASVRKEGMENEKSIQYQLLGSWKMTHGGEDFVILEFSKDGEKISGEVVRYLKESWTRFEIGEVSFPEDEDYQIFIRLDYINYDDGAWMELSFHDRGTLSGTIDGESYSRPFDIYGVKLR